MWWVSALAFVQTPRYLTFLLDFSLWIYHTCSPWSRLQAELLGHSALYWLGAEHKWEPGSSSFSFPYQAFVKSMWLPSLTWVSLMCRLWSFKLKCCANLAAHSQGLPVPVCCQTSPSYWQKCGTMYFLVYTRLTYMNFLTQLLNLWAFIGIFLYILLYREKSHVTRGLN